MSTVHYSYRIDGNLLAIEDLMGEVAVTMVAEQVLRDIRAEVGSLEGLYVIWRDRQGIWDGMEFFNGQLFFYPIGETGYDQARTRLLSLAPDLGECWIIRDALL